MTEAGKLYPPAIRSWGALQTHHALTLKPDQSAGAGQEDALLTGPLESINHWYAVAKIVGIKVCQAYRRQYGFDAICVQPTNVYGPKDNYDLESSDVVAALIRKFHEAKVSGAPTVTVWGTGTPRREFIHVDELADACVFLLEHYSSEEIVNIGTGQKVAIGEFAHIHHVMLARAFPV